MKVSDEQLDGVREHGFVVVDGFLGADELRAAQDDLWQMHPHPRQYDAATHTRYARSQFAGLSVFPFHGWNLNRLTVHPDLVDAAERYFGSTDLELYKAELWAKYAGAIDYDQPLHRDFGNHSLVVPRADGDGDQLTTFLLLSNVTEADGATRIVPIGHTRDVPMVPDERGPGGPFSLPHGAFADVEVPITGEAGALLIYRTDVFHRGAAFTEPGRSRFVMLVDFQVRGTPWTGKVAWPNEANSEHFVEAMEQMTPRQRDLFGFPPPGSAYWSSETLDGVQRRYPNMDMAPYRLSPGPQSAAPSRRAAPPRTTLD